MALFEEEKMTWREFEKLCEKLVTNNFHGDTWKVKIQPTRTYADGQTKRMDVEISERRQGGKHYVVDCKHFPKAALNEEEIITTLDYKRRSRASRAFILVSSASNCPQSFLDSARRQDVSVEIVSTKQYPGLLKWMRNGFFDLDLS